jgi:hypothetical protein
MKRIYTLIILSLVMLALISCDSFNLGDKPSGEIEGAKMTAEIVAIGDKIEVNVIEGEYGASGIYWVIADGNTPCFDADGSTIKFSSLKVGDRIEITYSGQVMMSYPPQIVAKRIVVLE